MQLKVRANEYDQCYYPYFASAPEASQPEPSTGDAAPAAEGNDAEDAETGEGPKLLLSKKEKERLKKEKEKVTKCFSAW
jgi:hypothetical protein